MVHGREVHTKHSYGFISDGLNQCLGIINGSHMKLPPVVRAIHQEVTYNVWVVCHMDSDELGRGGPSKVVCDVEGNICISFIDLELWWHG